MEEQKLNEEQKQVLHKTDIKAILPEFENQLEQEALISEAVADVIIIARLNDEETARKQFLFF